MEIEKTLKLNAPPADVWALLLDPQAMGACVPGMQSIDVISADEYAALMQVKISFISARFKLRTRIVERREPHYLRAEGTGEDASVASSLKQTTQMFLDARADGGTDLRLTVKVDLLGRMGTFGLSVMKTKADRLWDEFGVNLAARLGGSESLTADVSSATATPDATTASLPPATTPATAAQSIIRNASAQQAASSEAHWWPRLLRAFGIQPAAATASGDVIVVEVRRPDHTVIRVEWPAAKSEECQQWLREQLR